MANARRNATIQAVRLDRFRCCAADSGGKLDVRNFRASSAKSLSSMGLSSHVVLPVPGPIQAQPQVYLIDESFFKQLSYCLELRAVEWPLSSMGHAEQPRITALQQAKGRAQLR